jgi:hypothetical protein
MAPMTGRDTERRTRKIVRATGFIREHGPMLALIGFVVAAVLLWVYAKVVG